MSNKSSTEYLDEVVLDGKGIVVKDVMDSFKGYCGLFAFILSVTQIEDLSSKAKLLLIDRIISASMVFMKKKYKVNLDLYNSEMERRPVSGSRFNDSVIVPLKLQEDYEAGIEEARDLINIEIEDIFKILNINIDSE